MEHDLTYEQICFIRDNRLQLSNKEMADHLEVPVRRVSLLIKDYSWTLTPEQVYAKRAAKLSQISSSDPDTDDYLRTNYLLVPSKTMASNLGRSDTFVRTRMRQLGLLIPQEVIEQRKRDSQIKPGHIPPNKGKKQSDYMSPGQIAKTTGTRFKKGIRPHNTAEADGEIRIRTDHKNRNGRQYKWLRISLGNWVQLHRHNWEKTHGPIPKGMCLWAKDGDSLNCDPDNWELITRRENVLRNSGSRNLKDGYILRILAPRDPLLKDHITEQYPDLIELKRKELEANRIIRKHGQK